MRIFFWVFYYWIVYKIGHRALILVVVESTDLEMGQQKAEAIAKAVSTASI